MVELFQKLAPIQRAQRWSLVATSETNAQRRSVAPLFACGGVRHFFFAKSDGACASALSVAKHVFICASGFKEKSGQRLKIAFVAKGKTPTCVFSLFQAVHGLKFTLSWRFLTIKVISPLRRRPTLRALDGRSLFEKSDVKTF